MALLATYSTRLPNEDVPLYVGDLDAVDLARGEGEVLLDWLPSPWLRFHVETRNAPPITEMPPPIPRELVLIARHAATTAVVTGSEFRTVADGSVQAVRGVVEQTLVGESERIERLLFHVPNLPIFAGSPIQREDADGRQVWLGRLRLQDGVWQVTLDPVQDHRDLTRRLGETGGFALTTVGEIQRMDSAPFALSDAQDLLDSLRLFLSLLAGRWTQPMLLVGFGHGDQPVFEEWQSPRVDQWPGRRSVFPEDVREGDRMREPQLLPLFQSIRSLMSDETWQAVVTWGVSWLIESDKAVNADTSIVLSQAGLELLAWAKLVLEKGINAQRFKYGMAAHETLAALLDAIGVDTHIPNGTILHEMHEFASDGHIDGPTAFTMIRNGVVHPRAASDRPSARLRIEAAQLGKWYMELALLHLLHYKDHYINRLRSPMRPERVPWA